MNKIEAYIDDLFDCFPVNRTTKKMRLDLLEATSRDLDILKSHGMDEQETTEIIINQIAPAEKLATMIPNKYSWSYYFILTIGFIIGIYAFTISARPDFLQIFLPTKLEFPLIIAQYIQYLVICILFYAIIYLFYRSLPQKYISRTPWEANISLYIGTIMAALYFSISIAFVIFSFNGYLEEDINIFLRFFYQFFIQNQLMAYIYACINAMFFVGSRNVYHLDRNALPYELSEIYSQPAEAIESLTTDSHQDDLTKEETTTSEEKGNDELSDVEEIQTDVTETNVTETNESEIKETEETETKQTESTVDVSHDEEVDASDKQVEDSAVIEEDKEMSNRDEDSNESSLSINDAEVKPTSAQEKQSPNHHDETANDALASDTHVEVDVVEKVEAEENIETEVTVTKAATKEKATDSKKTKSSKKKANFKQKPKKQKIQLANNRHYNKKS